MYSERLREILENDISVNLLKAQISKDTEEIDDLAKLDRVTQDFFLNLNLFILSGEYVDLEITTRLTNHIESALNNLISSADEETEETQDSIMNGFLQPINHAVDGIFEIVRELNRKINGDKRTILLEGGKELKMRSDLFRISHHVRFFRMNCKVAIIDHSLSIDKKGKHLNNLIISIIELEEFFGGYIFKEILLDKCKFLGAKIYRRINKDEKSYLYTFNLKDKEIASFEDEVPIFRKFVDCYKSHYLGENEKARKANIRAIYEEAKISGYDLQKFHSLIKSYKDDTESIQQINNLINQFETDFKNIEQNLQIIAYDKMAWATCKNYIYNNKLSFFLQSPQFSLADCEASLNQIINIQNDTHINNYFPFLRFLRKINEELSETINGKKNDSIKDDIATMEKYIAVYERYISKLYLSFEWCQDNNFQSFALSKDLCLVAYQNNSIGSINLFAASSFVLPQNYTEISNEIDRIKSSFEEVKAHIPLFKRILSEEEEIRKIRDEVAKKERNQTEILGIFSAVVLFAAGGISIFKEAPSIEKAAKFSLIFSYSLSLFIILIWLITRDNNGFRPSRIHYWVIIIFIVVTYIILSISFSWIPFS
jgi:hypothetical protein